MTASAKPLPKSKRRAWTSSLKPKQLGVLGEQRAAQFLISRGFRILDRNIRVGGGELDIVAWDPHTRELVFVEVKTRTSSFSGDPSLAVDHRKLRALRRACHQYRKKYQPQTSAFRIDLITVLPGQLRHYPNISWELIK
ncbi:YraN family protein [Patescibacteria group bacterium]|nr:YraN family protein [Patescibacteria group bacterium]